MFTHSQNALAASLARAFIHLDIRIHTHAKYTLHRAFGATIVTI
jgi:hypothetical protein